MTVSIRWKLVILMLLTGVMPLLAALTILELEGGNLRTRSVGQAFLSAAIAEKSGLEASLRQDIYSFAVHLREPIMVREMRHMPAFPRMPMALAELDHRWPELSVRSPEVSAVLNHPLAPSLKHFQRTRSYCREVMLTDRYGQLVASTNKTSDFFQADEEWWRNAYADGRGRVYVAPVRFDESSNTWSVEICAPVLSEGESGAVTGVAKCTLDLGQWMAMSIPEVAPAAAESARYLVDDDGGVIAGGSEEPYKQALELWTTPATDLTRGQWYVIGPYLRATTSIRIPAEVEGLDVTAPRWWLVVQAPRRQALSEVYIMGTLVLAVGLAIIGTAFGIGLFIANRKIIEPLSRLRTATERVAAGDMSHSTVRDLENVTSRDEIGLLASDFNRMVASVEHSYIALSEANEMKSRFIRIAGHELRTPITFILAMVGLLLKKEEQNPQVRASLEKIRDRAQRLESIIAGIFTLLGEGRYGTSLNYSQFNILELVERICGEFRAFAESRGQRILVECVEHPPAVTADREKLHDAISNLVSNAVKFTPDNGVIKVTVQTIVGDRLAIRVRDQGEGIPEEDLPHIFDMFWSGGDVLKHSTGDYGYQKRGAGLGLAIAQQFARLHGGGIQVSNSSHGCVFSLIINAAPPPGEIETSVNEPKTTP